MQPPRSSPKPTNKAPAPLAITLKKNHKFEPLSGLRQQRTRSNLTPSKPPSVANSLGSPVRADMESADTYTPPTSPFRAACLQTSALMALSPDRLLPHKASALENVLGVPCSGRCFGCARASFGRSP